MEIRVTQKELLSTIYLKLQNNLYVAMNHIKSDSKKWQLWSSSFSAQSHHLNKNPSIITLIHTIEIHSHCLYYKYILPMLYGIPLATPIIIINPPVFVIPPRILKSKCNIWVLCVCTHFSCFTLHINNYCCNEHNYQVC